MKYTQSLKKNIDFINAYKKGKSYANDLLVMYVLCNKKDINRLGISVSKKVGNSVVRHRVTRLIRESYRLSESFFKKGFDIVIIGRPNAKEASYRDVEKAILHLGKLQKIYHSER